MKTARILLCLAYVAVLLATTPLVPPIWVPWNSTLISVIFGLALVHIANARVLTAVVAVAVVTLLVPAAVLSVVAWPHYPSLQEFFSSSLRTMREHNVLWGLEFVLPTLAAGVVLAITAAMRSNRTYMDSSRKARETP